MKPIVNIQNLSATYFPGRTNEAMALSDISLMIYSGEFIIFFGPSGCGKSTLFSILAGMEQNFEGEVCVNEQSLHCTRHELLEYRRKMIGIVFQSPNVLSTLTAAQNVALPHVALNKPAAERIRRSQSLLTQFGGKEYADRLPRELSGSQQQHIAICRAVMNNPPIILADEPVGNMDSKTSQKIMNVFNKLNTDFQKTIIMMTHDPSYLHIAHRIFYMRDGKITGTKTNSERERSYSPLTATASSLIHTIDHWSQTLPLTEESKNISVYMKKAQEIITEVLTGMTVEEVKGIEEKVFEFLHSNEPLYMNDILKHLMLSPAKGGTGLDKETAHKFATDITRLVQQVQHISQTSLLTSEESPEDADLSITKLEAKETRRYLLDRLDIRLPNLEAVRNMDAIISKRIEGVYNSEEVRQLFARPIIKGGADLDARLSYKVARHLETLVFTPLLKDADEQPTAASTNDQHDIDTLPHDVDTHATTPPPIKKPRKKRTRTSHTKRSS